jgi:hypothetical protein
LGTSFKEPIQNTFGDCYIISAMAAVAQYPDLVKNIFLTQSKNDAGIYALRLYVRGKPQLIVIDDAILLMSKPE